MEKQITLKFKTKQNFDYQTIYHSPMEDDAGEKLNFVGVAVLESASWTDDNREHPWVYTFLLFDKR